MLRSVAIVAALAVALAVLAVVGASARSAQAAQASWWTNCTQLHHRYKHGLGKLNAHDHTKSGTNAVTNFYRSTRLYNYATSRNSRLDADHDGVACEAH